MKFVYDLFLDSEEVDLKMLHSQYPGFEHYDVLSLTDGVVKFAEVKQQL